MHKNKTNKITLADAVKFVVDNRGRTAPIQADGIPLIATNCISNNNIYPTKDRPRYVSQETYDNWFRSHPQPGDIILTNKGSQNGAVCLVPDPVDFCIAQDMVALRANSEKIDPLYLFAALRSSIVQKRIKDLNVDAVIPHFKKTDFNKLFIPLLNRNHQEFIGRIYFDLSLKIEINRQINQTLEQMAQATFKSWFVDFEPVRIRRGESCISPYLTPEILALFPDELVDSELGEIPKGWEVSAIGDEVTVCGGGTPSTANPDFWDGDFAWVTPKDLSQQSDKVLIASERTISKAGVNKISSGQLPIGTVLLSSRAPIGYLSLTMIPVSINQGFIAMICNKRLPNTYILQWATASLDAIKQRGSGTTFAEISKANFRQMRVLVPSEEALTTFHAAVEPLYAEITVKARESLTLANLRDTLLPKLLSGELPLESVQTNVKGNEA